MKLVQDISIQQQQKLLMTPELRQAIAILQMSTLELNEYIQRELEENPFLEEKESEENVDYEKEAADNSDSKLEDWLEYYNDRDIGFLSREAEAEKSFENFFARRPSLYEHLEFQLRLSCKNRDELAIGNYLIGSIDRNGYLGIDLKELASHLEVSLEQVEEVLEMVHSFHPHGVGARDLPECLLLQLKHYGKESFLARVIIEQHMDDLARGRLNKIAQSLSVPVHQVQEISDLIRTLDPRPGLQYSNIDEIKYIIPDVFVEKVEGEYIVIVNDFHFPRLMVNQLYGNILRQPDSFPQDAKKYLEDKMGSAIWLIRSIEQRRMTLYKVARCIVDVQSEFLDKGIEFLKPLNLRQVATIVDVHESTVSRATTNKYIQTPQGLFELKYFFGAGLESCYGGEKVSSKSIKRKVEEIIAEEDSLKPLSDEAIAKLLKKRGYRISRRTVTKYRQEMGIPATTARKRF
ncbi:RNA polymerase factor sigma-54 [Syntrophomonas wolfei]|jgi:RNA polymerase sigma-54 factor|uniref:RNA polymerase sigma-54 factor n=1 Tax=Syntrophomonas wolfei TaxID=863 RepID=A0A354YYT1_9FIRM|nr:RNA polymerase factor sigma-54 [Syntrophomonas wolfei]HBK53387.1 RNA polymerase sigma-54 factor [Syntrophomonas wolfei]